LSAAVSLFPTADRKPRSPVYGSIEQAIGHTPLVRLRLSGVPRGVELWGKCEWFNPGGSVKDRTALSIVLEGERTGALRLGHTIIDSSSGNTAIGLALVGRSRGYAVELVLPESASAERLRLCEAYGARLILTDAFSGSDGAMRRVRELVDAAPERFFYADQYRNPANPLAHYRTTGPEIWDQTEGRITHFVAGLGTTGTVVGTGRCLHERNPGVQVVAVEPDEPLHGLEGLKHLGTSVVPEIWDARVPDRTVTVSTEAGLATREEVMSTNGLLVGHSAGAAIFAAREVARSLTAGVVVALLSDGGDRYLSSSGPAVRR
jgi:S-sulfo-L-cysteine synthase (O-acetyl-L-serine-dependent)